MKTNLKIGAVVRHESMPHTGFVVEVNHEKRAVRVLVKFDHKNGNRQINTVPMSEVSVVKREEPDFEKVLGIRPGRLVKIPNRPHWCFVVDVTPDKKYALVLPRFTPKFACYHMEAVHLSSILEMK